MAFHITSIFLLVICSTITGTYCSTTYLVIRGLTYSKLVNSNKHNNNKSRDDTNKPIDDTTFRSPLINSNCSLTNINIQNSIIPFIQTFLLLFLVFHRSYTSFGLIPNFVYVFLQKLKINHNFQQIRYGPIYILLVLWIYHLLILGQKTLDYFFIWIQVVDPILRLCISYALFVEIQLFFILRRW